MEFSAAYLATLLGRAVLCSFFLLAPFVGKLKLFYENPFAEFCRSAPLGAGVALFPVKSLAAVAGLFFQWGNEGTSILHVGQWMRCSGKRAFPSAPFILVLADI